MIYRYTVPEEIAAISARDFCTRYIGLSHRLWKRLKWNGQMLVNGQEVRAAITTLHGGEEIRLYLPETDNLRPAPLSADLPLLDIVYEDDKFLVLNKPAGLLVHPTPREPVSLLGAAVLAHYRERGIDAIFHLVHRLDRDTTGLLLIAKEPQVQNLLLKPGEKRFSRRYLAIVSGHLTPLDGTIDLPLGQKDGSIVEQCVRPDGKRAITHYQTVAIAKWPNELLPADSEIPFAPPADISLLEISLDTGRTHQIRAHFSHLGHPLLGDDLYGPARPLDFLINRQALHAYRLELIPPWLNGKKLEFTAPLPDDFSRLLSLISKGNLISPSLWEKITALLR